MEDFFAGDLVSPRNARVRAALDLHRSAAARRASGSFLVEGIKLVNEAVQEGVPLLDLFVSPGLLRHEGGPGLLATLKEAGAPLLPVADGVMERLSESRTPQGILATAVRPTGTPSLPPPIPGRPLLVGWHIQDPGNLGALIRIVEATGAAGFLAAGGGADPYHPRAVRATAGSLFRVQPLECQDAGTLLATLRDAGLELLAAVPRHGDPPSTFPWNRPWALLIGGEGEGLPEALLKAAGRRVAIPTEGRVESLSVPAAAAMLLYEAQRHRLTPAGRPQGGRSAARPRRSRHREPRGG
ncbi:MAG: RNA methyltransferase [Acidobacteria bacterium]|nr:RNA methyltransferase [Acidobacteriota bacterium]